MSTGPEKTFRRAEPEEIDRICEIASQAWENVYEARREILGDGIFEAIHLNWQEQKKKQVRGYMERYPGRVFVTEIGGEVAGFATLMFDENSRVGEIGNNAVSPDHQGLGIGTFQHKQVIEILRGLGMRVVKVTTGGDAAHIPARRSYEKAGFEKRLESVTYFMELD